MLLKLFNRTFRNILFELQDKNIYSFFISSELLPKIRRLTMNGNYARQSLQQIVLKLFLKDFLYQKALILAFYTNFFLLQNNL